jgi:hypothetical protein
LFRQSRRRKIFDQVGFVRDAGLTRADVEASRAIRQAEVGSARGERTRERFDI